MDASFHLFSFRSMSLSSWFSLRANGLLVFRFVSGCCGLARVGVFVCARVTCGVGEGQIRRERAERDRACVCLRALFCLLAVHDLTAYGHSSASAGGGRGLNTCF